MLAYWDTDLNKSADFFLNPICILLVVCTSTIAVCIVIYANKILFKLSIHLNYHCNIINAWRLSNTKQICARTMKPWNVCRCMDHFYHIKLHV